MQTFYGMDMIISSESIYAEVLRVGGPVVQSSSPKSFGMDLNESIKTSNSQKSKPVVNELGS